MALVSLYHHLNSKLSSLLSQQNNHPQPSPIEQQQQQHPFSQLHGDFRLHESSLHILSSFSPSLILATTLSALIIFVFLWEKSGKTRSPPGAPPVVPYWIPFIGSLFTYGINPLKFLQTNREKYGDIFTFVMWGRRMTYALGPAGNNFVFNARLSQTSAEEAYRSLTVPVFGSEVVYDVDNAVFMEQKKFVKGGFSTENLRSYVPLIEKETTNYFARWEGRSGESDAFTALAELTIMTASSCLMGPEVRAQLDERVAKLYHHLDQGFQPINFLFKWLPLPSYYRRDRAHAEMRSIFMNIMKRRRASGTSSDYHDMLQTFMECNYKNGKQLSDRQAAHLMIALLMAGQHTSSTTGTWALMFLAANSEIQAALRQELFKTFGDSSSPLTYEGILSSSKSPLLDSVVRETLRLRPPLIAIMRKTLAPLVHPPTGYVVPEGDFLCASPVISQLDPKEFKNAETFDPYRWMSEGKAVREKDFEEGDGVDFGFGMVSKSANSPYLPFGAGRHRCIGEAFAYVQLKAIIATVIRTFELELTANGFPETDFTSMVVMPKRPVLVRWKRLEK